MWNADALRRHLDEVERLQLVDDRIERTDGVFTKSISVGSPIYSAAQAQAHHHRVCDLQRTVDYLCPFNQPQILQGHQVGIGVIGAILRHSGYSIHVPAR